MKNIISVLILCITLTGCAAPRVVTGNSRSVVIDDGQLIGHKGLGGSMISNATEPAAKAEADRWCAKYNRVSGVEQTQSDESRKEFACVDK